MLGLADRSRVLDLLDHLFQGNIKSALDELRAQYDLGADPLEVLRDLLELTHWLTRLQITGETGEQVNLSKTQQARGLEMADKLSMGTLARTWQILLKGLGEAQSAPRALDTAEMVLVRLAYASDLPTPDEIIRRSETGAKSGASKASWSGRATEAVVSQTTGLKGGARQKRREPKAQLRSETSALTEQTELQARAAHTSAPATGVVESFEDVLELASAKRDIRLRTELESYVHLVRFEVGRIEFRPATNAPKNLAGRLASQLTAWTGSRWIVSLSNDAGAKTVASARRKREMARDAKLKEHPLVKAAFKQFPNAEIVAIRERNMAADAPDPNTKDHDETWRQGAAPDAPNEDTTP
jgi:DNA polymerase-3 subunit gamma/tau